MTLRACLLASSLLYAVPAMAFVDPPAASTNDGRIRQVVYDPDNPVEIYAVPGASLRIELGAGETVVQIVTSDQGTLRPDQSYPPVQAASAATGIPGPQIPPSCDADMCRSVASNFIYIKPIRPLDPQPLFIQTERIDENGKVQQVAYTFELLTRPTDLPARHGGTKPGVAAETPLVAPTVWGVRFIYPERVKAAQAAAWWRQKKAADDQAKQAAELVRANAAIPGPDANWRYGYRGSAAVQPDAVWDNGRTTFLRFNGNRRIPNVYNKLPDGHESIPAVAPEPDETGNTLRIARTESKWFLRDGDEAGCLFDLGPDPDGRTAPTVAQTVTATKAAVR
jgi:type IV secretion system protein VirB9